MNDEEDVLKEIREVIARDNWVTFDTETTHLEGEVIQWAVHDPKSGITGQGLVKAKGPISREAQRFHHIQDKDLVGALTFPQAWSVFTPLMEGKDVVIYNANFDIGRLLTSLGEHKEEMDIEKAGQWLHTLSTYCAMEWFAVLYGEWSDYHGSYTYQSLATACRYYNIPLPKAHQALDDAIATAELVKKMAEDEE